MAKATKMTKKAPTYGGRNKPKAAKADKPVKKAFPLVGKTDLNKLLARCFDYQNRASTATGAMGELVREYAETKHLHAGAFAIISGCTVSGDHDPQASSGCCSPTSTTCARSPGSTSSPRSRDSSCPPSPTRWKTKAEPQPENVVTYPREVAEQAGEHAA